MKTNFTKRDLKFFLLGAVVILLITVIFDWQDFKDGFQAGLNAKW